MSSLLINLGGNYALQSQSGLSSWPRDGGAGLCSLKVEESMLFLQESKIGYMHVFTLYSRDVYRPREKEHEWKSQNNLGENFLGKTYEFKAVSHLISPSPSGIIIPLAVGSLHLGCSSTRVAWHIPLSHLHKIDVNGETHCQSLPGRGTLEPA